MCGDDCVSSTIKVYLAKRMLVRQIGCVNWRWGAGFFLNHAEIRWGNNNWIGLSVGKSFVCWYVYRRVNTINMYYRFISRDTNYGLVVIQYIPVHRRWYPLPPLHRSVLKCKFYYAPKITATHGAVSLLTPCIGDGPIRVHSYIFLF